MKQFLAVAKPFSTEKRGTYWFSVDTDNTLSVYDDMADHFTTCHDISERVRNRIISQELLKHPCPECGKVRIIDTKNGPRGTCDCADRPWTLVDALSSDCRPADPTRQ